MGEDVAYLAALELIGFELFERNRFGLSRSDILSGLVEMPFGGFDSFGVVLLDVLEVRRGQPMKLPACTALTQVVLTR